MEYWATRGAAPPLLPKGDGVLDDLATVNGLWSASDKGSGNPLNEKHKGTEVNTSRSPSPLPQKIFPFIIP